MVQYIAGKRVRTFLWLAEMGLFARCKSALTANHNSQRSNMINTIKTFIAKIRQSLFERRLESEIYGEIAPHVLHEKKLEYPFDSMEGLARAASRASREAQRNLAMIEKEGQAMPEAYGEAFRYIAFSDLNHRMAAYRELARRRIYPKTCDPRLVARRA
jgi:hypothetical protein